MGELPTFPEPPPEYYRRQAKIPSEDKAMRIMNARRINQMESPPVTQSLEGSGEVVRVNI